MVSDLWASDLVVTVTSILHIQDEYSRLSRNASLGVHGYVLVFSIASRQSLEMIRQVNDLLLSTLGDAPDVPRVLVGSMKDLAAQRQVLHAVRRLLFQISRRKRGACIIDTFLFLNQDAQKLADSWGVPYLECSSKTGESVAEVFHTLMKEIEKDDGLLAETNEGGCAVQ